MVNFKEEIAKLIAQQVEGLELSEIETMVEVPQGRQDGRLCVPVLQAGEDHAQGACRSSLRASRRDLRETLCSRR